MWETHLNYGGPSWWVGELDSHQSLIQYLFLSKVCWKSWVQIPFIVSHRDPSVLFELHLLLCRWNSSAGGVWGRVLPVLSTFGIFLGLACCLFFSHFIEKSLAKIAWRWGRGQSRCPVGGILFFFNVPSKEKCLALTGLTSHPLRKGEGRWKWVTRQLKNAFWIRRYFLNYFMHFINKIAWLTNEGGHQFFFFYGLTLRPLFFSVLGACKNRNTKNVLYLRQWWQGGNIKNNKHIRKRCVFSRNCTNCGFTAQCNRKRCKKKPPNTRKHDTKSKYGKWVCSADHKFNMQLWGQCSSALLTLIGCVMWLVTVIGRPSLCPDWAGETPKRETSAHESYLFLSRPSSRFLGNEINFIMSPISPCWVLAF